MDLTRVAIVVAISTAIGCSPEGTAGPARTDAAIERAPVPERDPRALAEPIVPLEVPEVDDAIVDEVVAGLNAFTLDFHRVAAADDGNQVTSPASVAVVLGMVHAGANGETAREIVRALHVEREAPRLADAFAVLLADWNAITTPHVLSVVDRVYGRTGIDFDPVWLDVTRTRFGAELGSLDFAGDPEGSRREINEWVASATHERIVDLLPPGAVGGHTGIVLVNAVYFLGRWEDPFREHRTEHADFFAPMGTRRVPMMRGIMKVPHAAIRGNAVAVVRLACRGSMELVVVLPDAPDGLAALETSLDSEVLARWIDATKATLVDVSVPRVRIEDPTITLREPLGRLGIRRLFDPGRAQLAGIANASLGIREGYHRTFFAIDENGIEAAAATALAGKKSASPRHADTIFRADRPFLFFLHDTQTGAILFIGRVTAP